MLGPPPALVRRWFRREGLRERGSRLRRSAEFCQKVGVIQSSLVEGWGAVGSGSPGGLGALFGFAMHWALLSPPSSRFLSLEVCLSPARDFGRVVEGGHLAAGSPSSGSSFCAPPPIHQKSTRSGSPGDLGVRFPQRDLGKLIPAVSWWGRGRPEARRPPGRGKGVGGKAPRVRRCNPVEKLRGSCDPETPFTYKNKRPGGKTPGPVAAGGSGVVVLAVGRGTSRGLHREAAVFWGGQGTGRVGLASGPSIFQASGWHQLRQTTADCAHSL